MNTKRVLCFVLLYSCLFFLVFSGCKIQEISTEPVTLWVLTEKTVPDGMNYQVDTVSAQISEDYPNVTVRVDYLPTDPEERAQYVQELKSGIAEGKAPDVYLLPTKEVLVLSEPSKYTYVQIEPFFSDVAYEMYNDRFYDISRYYNKDKDLGKDGLLESVMDAGTIGRKRYVIPLRFTMPVVYLTGDNAVSFESTRIDDLMRTAVDGKDSALARGIINYGGINLFSDVIDYQNKQITLSTQQLKEYLSLYRKLDALPDSSSMNNKATFEGIEYLIEVSPIRISTLEGYLTYNAYTQYKKNPLQAQPLESMDGDTIATIQYWGGVDASCQNPQMAYEFLSRFLSEEFQWELTRPTPAEHQYGGLVEESWPVRARNAAENLWPNIRAQLTVFNPYHSIVFDEAEIASLYNSIDFARFNYWDSFGRLKSEACKADNDNKLDTLIDDYLSNIAKQYPDYTIKIGK